MEHPRYVYGVKPQRKDYFITFFQMILILIATGCMAVYQFFWKLFFRAEKESRKVQEERIRKVATLALSRVTKPLAKGPEPEGIDESTSLVKKETCLKVINGAEAVHAVMRQFLRFNPFWTRNLTFEVPPEELNKTTHIYMGNHTSYSDFCFCSGMGINLTACGKASLLDIPVAGRVLKNAGILPVYFKKKPDGKWGTDQEKTQMMLETAVEYLQYGASVLVFPEGKINPEYELAEFKRGFFNVARTAGVDVVPFAIWGATEVWGMEKIHTPKIPFTSGTAYVRVGSPMPMLWPAKTSFYTTVDDLAGYLEETYEINMNDEREMGDIPELMERIIAQNAEELSGTEEYALNVLDLFRGLVKKRVFQLRLVCEEMQRADLEKKKKK